MQPSIPRKGRKDLVAFPFCTHNLFPCISIRGLSLFSIPWINQLLEKFPSHKNYCGSIPCYPTRWALTWTIALRTQCQLQPRMPQYVQAVSSCIYRRCIPRSTEQRPSPSRYSTNSKQTLMHTTPNHTLHHTLVEGCVRRCLAVWGWSSSKGMTSKAAVTGCRLTHY